MQLWKPNAFKNRSLATSLGNWLSEGINIMILMLIFSKS